MLTADIIAMVRGAMSAEGTDLLTDVLSIDGDQPSPVFIVIACRMQV